MMLIALFSLLMMLIAFFLLKGFSKDSSVATEYSAAEYREQCPQIEENIINDGHQGTLAHEEWIKGAVLVDEEVLAKTVQQWTSNPCVFLDGKERLQTLRGGNYQVFSGLGTEDSWVTVQQRVELIRKKYPREAFSALLEAEYWVSYAWYARGDRFSSSVTPEGWKLFHERLERAEGILRDSKSYASVLPGWYQSAITVLSALGKKAERDEVFIEGASRFKTYVPIFTVMGYFSLPRWGGSWKAVDAIARWPLEKLNSSEGYQMYAKIYESVNTDLGRSEVLFRDTKADWPTIKRGFDKMTEQYSSSKWLLNGYAYMACMADDAETYRSIRKKLGEDFQTHAWRYPYSPEVCDSKYSLTEK